MSSRSKSLAVWFGVGVAVLAAAGMGVYFIHQWVEGPADPEKALFRESAEAVGITFKMQFLPNEQGETFKINLYDHGCGRTCW